MAGSSDKRIVLDTDNMRDIAATYTVGGSNAIQIKPRSNLVSISIPKVNSIALKSASLRS
jgi:hypothetical protein